jgi:uncharacterized membrane protein
MANKQIVRLTTFAMFIALMLILALVPNFGIITVGPVSITIMHIPVIVVALVLGLPEAIGLGLVFGLASWFVALTRGATPIDLLFTNPMVAVVPRVLFGLIVGWLGQVWKKQSHLFIGLTALFGTLAHTLLVLGFIVLFGQSIFAYDGLSAGLNVWLTIVGSVLLSNGIWEIIVAVLICVPLVSALRRFTSRNGSV